MTREQVIDEAVRRVFIRPGMKNPMLILTTIINRDRAFRAYHESVPNWFRRGNKWYAPIEIKTHPSYLVDDLEASDITQFVFRPNTARGVRMLARIRAEFHRIEAQAA